MVKILLAEDGPDHARILMGVLKKAGYEVTWFQNGSDIYDYLAKEAMPDLLITDILMPGMSGFELLARLKEINKMPPTIVITGKQREEDILRGLQYGVLDYIPKPFSPSIVIAKIKNALGRGAA